MRTGIKKTALALTLALLLPLTGLAADLYGAQAVEEGEPYTVEQMLTYALQDEQLAQAGYAAIIDAYGAGRPYTNILRAEGAHIQWLLPLFAAHDVAVPENTAAERIVLPPSLQDSYAEEVKAEELNIAMYAAFLQQENLPDDLRAVFENLKRGSENHLAAFQQNANRPANGGNGRNRNADNSGPAGGSFGPGSNRPGNSRWGK